MTTPRVDELYTIGNHGKRRMVHPADVHGRFTRLRRAIAALLVVIMVALPFIEINGRPAVWLDIVRRRFHLFGISLGPTDSYWLFFLLTGVGFSLIVASALWGRVWCGYACPQTVFLETVFRRIERWIEGSREQRMRLQDAPWTWPKIWRRGLKLSVFLLLSATISHVLLSYFVSPKLLWAAMREGPASSPGAFAVSLFTTSALFFNFAWFREQFCIILCPYGRLQSVLSDRDTVIIGYDEKRGEPRGKVENAGDCIACNRCIAVCPTGIDIRQGLQLECVGCANCIDACDEIMLKVGSAPGLIRYDTQRVFSGEKKRFWRPRVFFYAALGLLGMVALTLTATSRPSLPATLSRQVGAPFTVEGEVVRNAFVLRVQNRGADAVDWAVVVDVPASVRVILPTPTLHLAPYEQRVLPLFIEATAPKDKFDVRVRVGTDTLLSAPFLFPAVR